MGSNRSWKCGRCGYEFFGSGGPDHGFIAVTRTFECTECQILFDGTIGTETRYSNDKNGVTRKPVHCPQCKKKKSLLLWDFLYDPHCPKKACGGKMDWDENGNYEYWD
jgi:hypothetical protein